MLMFEEENGTEEDANNLLEKNNLTCDPNIGYKRISSIRHKNLEVDNRGQLWIKGQYKSPLYQHCLGNDVRIAKYENEYVLVCDEVLQSFVPRPSEEHDIAFLDGNVNNCRLENLAWHKAGTEEW